MASMDLIFIWIYRIITIWFPIPLFLQLNFQSSHPNNGIIYVKFLMLHFIDLVSVIILDNFSSIILIHHPLILILLIILPIFCIHHQYVLNIKFLISQFLLIQTSKCPKSLIYHLMLNRKTIQPQIQLSVISCQSIYSITHKSWNYVYNVAKLLLFSTVLHNITTKPPQLHNIFHYKNKNHVNDQP